MSTINLFVKGKETELENNKDLLLTKIQNILNISISGVKNKNNTFLISFKEKYKKNKTFFELQKSYNLKGRKVGYKNSIIKLGYKSDKNGALFLVKNL